ncbi:hypothetical protein LINPERHAP2_LOCUS19699, partial [Linum perenne]
MHLLVRGPISDAISYTSYDVNGYRYRIVGREMTRTTQNSGVFVDLATQSYASSSDTRPVEGSVPYYG